MKKRSERLLSLLLAISLVLSMIVLPAPVNAETAVYKTVETIGTYSTNNSGWTFNWGSNSYGEIDLTGSDSFVIDFDLLFKGAGRIDFSLTPVDKSSTRIFYVKTIDFPGTVAKKMAAGEYVRVSFVVNQKDNTYSLWFDGVSFLEGSFPASMISDTGRLQFKHIKFDNVFDAPDGGVNVYASYKNGKIYDGTQPEYVNADAPDYIADLFGSPLTTLAIGGTDRYIWDYSQNNKLYDYTQFVWETEIAGFDGANAQLVVYENKDNGSRSLTAATVLSDGNAKFAGGEYVKVAIAIDTTAKTYSVWVDGTKTVDAASITLSDFEAGYLRINCLTAGSMKIQSMRVYEGTEPIAPEEPDEQPSEPVKPTIPATGPEITKTYLAEDFEGTPALSLLWNGEGDDVNGKNVNKVEGDETNHYARMETRYTTSNKYTKIYKSFAGVIDTNYIVISLKMASTGLASTGVNYGSFRFIGFNGDGTLYTGSGPAAGVSVKMPGDGTWVNFEIAIDIEGKTYSVWMDDVQIISDAAHNLTAPGASFQIDHSEIGGNLLVDDLVFGSYAVQATPDPSEPTDPSNPSEPTDPSEPSEPTEPEEPTEPPVIPEINKTYLDQNFETDSKGVALLPGTLGEGDVNEVRGDASNHYVYMTKATADMKLYASVASKVDSNYILVSVDVASTDLATTHIKIAGAKGSQYAASFNNTGKITASGADIGLSKTVPADGTFVNFIIVVNGKTGKYDLWVDGELAVAGKTTNIGTFSYMQIEHTETGGNVMVDNLKICSYGDGSMEDDEIVLEGVTGEITVPGDLGNKVYYELDFEKYSDINSVLTIKQSGSGQRAEGAGGNHYVHLTNNAKLLLNYNGKDVSDYVVFSADIASTNLESSYIKIYGTGAASVSLNIYVNAFGQIQYNGKHIGTLKKNGTFVNVAVAINSKTQKCHIWINGTMMVYDAPLPANYGKVRYIQFEPAGTDGTNFMVDNLKLYDGVQPIADLPEQPKPNPGKDRYYENNFNENKTGVSLSGGAKLDNGRVKMMAYTQLLWNYYRDYDLTGCVIFQADVYASAPESLYIQPVSDTGAANLVIFRVDGTLTPSYKPAEDKLKAGGFVNVAIMVNTIDKTYTIWFDGEEIVSNSMLPSSFGTLQYWRIDYTGGSPTSYALIDNMKVFNGLHPSAFAGTTVPVIDNTRDYSWMNEYIGKESSFLDYGTEVLSILNTQYRNAIVVHAGSNYVYQNGRRVQKTADEVAALVSANSKKVVYKDENGLIIINNGKVSLSEKNIESLHSFMLYTRPKMNELKQLFESVTTNEHPRIVLNQEKMDKIAADFKTNDLVKKWGKQVIVLADTTLKNSHAKYIREDGTRMSACRTVLDRSLNLSMAFILTGDTKYKDYLWEELENAAGFKDWNSKHHYLDTGEFAAGFAIAYDWLYHEWTPEQRAVLENAMRDNALYFQHRMSYDLETGNATYIYSETNRNAVTNGGVGLAALAVFDVYPDECADILEKIYHMLERLMNEFGPDGANTEGPAYWDYLMRFLSKFMASTELTFGTDFNIYKAPGFATTGEFYLDVDGMSGANNFHDATESTHLVSGYLFWLSNALNKPDLTKTLLFKMNQYKIMGNVYSIMFYDTDIKMDSNITMPKDAYYGNMELVSMRSSWVNRGGIYVSAHTGKTTMSHAHIDSGTFVVDIGGQRFAGDIGKEDYTLAAAGANRYYYYRIRPEGHNVFVINPDKTGMDLGQSISNEANETVSKFVTKDRGAYAILPLDSYYAPYASSATRGIMLGDERTSVLIRDEIRGMKQNTNEVWWFMQLPGVNVEISEDKKSAVLEKNGVYVNLQVASDNATNWEIRLLDTKTMYDKPNLPDTDKQSVNTGWSRLAIVFTAGKDLNINVKMAEQYDSTGDTPIVETPLAEWDIPDGYLKEKPTLQGIYIGDQELPDFESEVTFYNYGLPYKSTECPEVTVIGGEGCDIDISIPKSLPGYIKITLKNKNDKTLKTTYKIMVTVNGVVTLEASDFQDGNPPQNCLDGNMATRWSVEGEAWGIFRFAEPQIVKAVWVATWLQAEESRLFDIWVSEDGENFTEVLKVATEFINPGEEDRFFEYKIPEGTYRAIKFVCHGAKLVDGSDYVWNSFLEVKFDMVSAVNPDEGGGFVPPSQGGSDDGGSGEGGIGGGSIGEWIEQITSTEGGTAWLIVGIVGVVAVLGGAGVAVFFILKKKGVFKKKETVEVPTDEAT